MRRNLARAGAVPALAALALIGAPALATGANAAVATPASGPTVSDVPADPADPGYATGAYDRGYAQGMRDGEHRTADRGGHDSTYAPSSAAQTGPNTADAPRASEASTSHDEACGTNPGENDHTLGLPKLVNVNTC